MCSIESLLNPVKSVPRGTQQPSSPSPLNITSSAHGSPLLTIPSPMKKPKMTKDGAVFIKAKTKGEVIYPPFEPLDEEIMRACQKFQVFPLGTVQDYPRSIPYHSGKKDFFEKTGREGFEVFQYTFKLGDDHKEYSVTWDYNNGLVRMTCFFKCCGFGKTMPAKVLNMNPGLKEITHSITGGALVAQGYWMPYDCALAVCRTFCWPFAAALIPIFGPNFPSLCVLPESPEHKRMRIDPQIIVNATAQAEAFRQQYSILSNKSASELYSAQYSSTPRPSIETDSLPQSSRTPLPSMRMSPPPSMVSSRPRLKRAHAGTSSYAGTTDTDASPRERSSSTEEYLFTPGSSNSPQLFPALPQYHRHMSSDPTNSTLTLRPVKFSIPRSSLFMDGLQSTPMWYKGKKRVQEMIVRARGTDDEHYDGGESRSTTDEKESPSLGYLTGSDAANVINEEDQAALALVSLSGKDWEIKTLGRVVEINESRAGTVELQETEDDGEKNGPIAKRMRRASM